MKITAKTKAQTLAPCAMAPRRRLSAGAFVLGEGS